MPTPCPCCNLGPPCCGSCGAGLCRYGCPGGPQGLPPALLCSIIIPGSGRCCCAYPSGGMITFPLLWIPGGIGEGYLPDSQSPCHFGVGCSESGIASPPGWGGYPGTTPYLDCHDYDATRCITAGFVWSKPVFQGWVSVCICIGAGQPGFFLNAVFGPYDNLTTSGACPQDNFGLNPCVLSQGTGGENDFMGCHIVRAKCQPPDALFFRPDGYDCGNLLLQWTVDTDCGFGRATHSCGPYTIVVQTPPP